MPTQPISILIADDDEGDRRLIIRALKQAGLNFNFALTASIQEALAASEQAAFDCAIVDYLLPGEHGLDGISYLRKSSPHMAIVMVTGQGDELIATEAMKRGASDYLPKASISPESIYRAIQNAMDKANLLRTVAQQRDELARMAAEEYSRQIQDEILSHVSHELRSPLASISSYCSLMVDGLAGPTTGRQIDFLKIIGKNVKQLDAMIEDLLIVTAAKSAKLTLRPRAVSLEETIADVVQACEAGAKAKGVDLSYVPAARMADAYADPAGLLQVMIVLCDNAIKFTPSGGRVKLRAMQFERNPEFLVIEVADTGRGIPPEKMDRIFEHLYQVPEDGDAARKGLGLGLHIARELVVGHGGEIWATSELGIGSQFFFTVPIFAEQNVAAALTA